MKELISKNTLENTFKTLCDLLHADHYTIYYQQIFTLRDAVKR